MALRPLEFTPVEERSISVRGVQRPTGAVEFARIVAQLDGVPVIAMNLPLVLEAVEETLRMQFDAAEAAPADVLPTLRFLEHVCQPNRLVVRVQGLVHSDVATANTEQLIDPVWVETVRSLAFVQRHAGVSFLVPAQLGATGLRALRTAEESVIGQPGVLRGRTLISVRFARF